MASPSRLRGPSLSREGRGSFVAVLHSAALTIPLRAALTLPLTRAPLSREGRGEDRGLL